MDLSSKQFDLKEAAEKGAWCQLVNPITGEELGVDETNPKKSKPTRIRVKGADSATYDQAVAHTAAMRQRETPSNKKRITDSMLLESMDKQKASRAVELAKVTMDWENIEMDGKPFPFNFDNAIELYRKHDWLADQVSNFFGDRTNYLGNA